MVVASFPLGSFLFVADGDGLFVADGDGDAEDGAFLGDRLSHASIAVSS